MNLNDLNINDKAYIKNVILLLNQKSLSLLEEIQEVVNLHF